MKNSSKTFKHQFATSLAYLVGQKAVSTCDPIDVFLSCRCVIYNGVLQAVPFSNGTSFDFVTTKNGPVCLDLYSTPQYKMDQARDGTGEPLRCFSDCPRKERRWDGTAEGGFH